MISLTAPVVASLSLFTHGFQDEEGPFGRTIVTASRIEETQLETPYATERIDSERIFERGIRSMPEVLADMPGILLQATAHGQGSPYIRGFTGFRNVFLIDGVRLNNSVFRSGPNQYWATVDAFSIDRLEVVKGPSSVQYGSDAIGGTVNAITKSPFDVVRSAAPDGTGRRDAASLFYRYASAENSHIGRAEAATVDGAQGFLVGATGKTFGDLVAGEPTGTQPETGYDEWDADVKSERILDDGSRLSVLYQNVSQNDVPRTHKTDSSVSFQGTTNGGDKQRDLDQNRQLLYVQMHGDSYSAGVSWHEQREYQHRIRSDFSVRRQGFEVDTLGAFGTYRTDAPLLPSTGGRTTVGFEAYHDSVDSFASNNPVQGPVADDATYSTVGVFVEDEVDAGDDWTFTLGARYSRAEVDANRVRNLSGLVYSVEDDWSRVVGSARFLYRLDDESNLFGGISQGFRAPNLSDLTMFDDVSSNEFETPATDLEPEKFNSYELGVKHQSDRGAVALAFFYTDIEDVILRFRTGAMVGSQFELSKANAGDGYVYGVELGGEVPIDESWSLFANGTYMYGKADTYDATTATVEEQYLDRLMPTTILAGARWEGESDALGRLSRSSEPRPWFEGSAQWVDDADRLSTRDANDTDRIPPGGTPGYVRVDLDAGLRLSPRLEAAVGLHNIADEDYRVHGSGQNAAGRSLILSLTYRR